MHSYPSIYNLGHKQVLGFLDRPVYVQEKVDGSQFSFGIEDGELTARSKGAKLYLDAPEKMFSKAIDTVKQLAPVLKPGYTYRGEYLQKPKHNSLAYSRTPERNIILFDIDAGLEDYLPYKEVTSEAARIGLETVPLFYAGKVEDPNSLRDFLDKESILGGQKVEGVVIKAQPGHQVYGPDKKPLLVKFVSEAFKEIHSGEWKKSNPSSNDILEMLGAEYRTPARWQKALIHLAERGALTDSPKDIGVLLKEVGTDVHKECAEEIKEKLMKWAWPHVQRKIIAGLPEWYKEELAKKEFN